MPWSIQNWFRFLKARHALDKNSCCIRGFNSQFSLIVASEIYYTSSLLSKLHHGLNLSVQLHRDLSKGIWLNVVFGFKGIVNFFLKRQYPVYFYLFLSLQTTLQLLQQTNVIFIEFPKPVFELTTLRWCVSYHNH